MKAQLNIANFKRVYFIGIGGIGMSALARYFNLKGLDVAGYDKTRTPLTKSLEAEGMNIHYEDLGESLPEGFGNPEDTVVVYTPAIPAEMRELKHVHKAGFVVLKRAQMLGVITANSKALGVAGTHGKTTTSTMLAHIMNESSLKCNAFLGGIATNFNANFISDAKSDWTVVEADEFDRSFLNLKPYASIVTSTDADHLDIYGDKEVLLQGFKDYVKLIDKEGVLVRHKHVALSGPSTITYGLEDGADFVGKHLRYVNGAFLMDVQTPLEVWEDVRLGVPGTHNAENALACIALAVQLGITEKEIRHALRTFRGVKRRFEYHINTQQKVYIDDYAHHPTEINALIDSVRLLYPGKRVLGVFQPHLFSRTRDFFEEFAKALSRLDELVLMPIYPAREKPIPGVTSEALLHRVKGIATLLDADAVVEHVIKNDADVILTIGAGDIDRIVPEIKKYLAE